MILVEILTALSLVGELQQMSLPIQGGRQMSRFQLCIQHTSHNRQGAQETRVLSSCNELRHAPKCGLNVHQVECGPMQGGWVYVYGYGKDFGIWTSSWPPFFCSTLNFSQTLSPRCHEN